MKKKKIIKITLIILLSLGILGGLTLLGGLYVGGDIVFNKMFSSYFEEEVANNLGLEAKDKKLSDIKLQDLIEGRNTVAVDAQGDSHTQPSQDETVTQTAGGQSESVVEGKTDTTSTEATQSITSTKPSVAGDKTNTQSSGIVKIEDYVDLLGPDASVQDMVDYISSQVSAVDKVRISSLIMNNLSTGDIQYLAGMASGGYSSSELQAAKKLARQRFSGPQLDEVYYYYNKYSYLIP